MVGKLNFKIYDGIINIKEQSDINISDDKWDFLFKNPIFDNWSIYFNGWRFDCIYENEIDEQLSSIIEDVSDLSLIDKGNHVKLLIKLKGINRNLLNTLWKYYEYPSIIFLKNKSDQDRLIDKYLSYNRDMYVINDSCIIYKVDPESDVLWIQKDNNIRLQIDENNFI